MRGRRYVLLGLLLAALTIIMLTDNPRRSQFRALLSTLFGSRPGGAPTTGGDPGPGPPGAPPTPKYLPEPTWTPPPVKDPFPFLATAAKPPPIPAWNVPKKDLHVAYGLDYAPPLLIGFTRSWPILLQAVVSYITAGWPADQIYVVENTGVQRANLEGRLTLQNPFYLNHAQLAKLGVHVVRSPVLMSFAQLQNFYVHLAHEHGWRYYFWSHQDVLALSFEGGNDDVMTGPWDEEGYKTLYELCLAELRRAVDSGERWADRFFAYDHLTLVNREAYDEVGGWDTFIPYYITDCDMHSRLLMHNWTQRDAKAGIITDVSTALDDLLALYRDPTLEPSFTDPNPPAPPNMDRTDRRRRRKRVDGEAPELVYWYQLQQTADHMWHYKHGERGRNTWQLGQKGGQGEPFYYDARGLAVAIDVLTEAGREVFRRKWGHKDCDLIAGAGLKLEDQWLVEQDWV